MALLDPQNLAQWTSGRWDREPPGRVSRVVFDSRRAGPGDLFVCLKTERRDGHEFLGMAEEKGAAAALVSRANPSIGLPQLVVAEPLAALQEAARRHREGLRGPLIGVTGSCGKTSTKELLVHLMGELGDVCASHGNFNNHIGVPVSLLSFDPKTFQRGVVEAGINLPGEMDILAGTIAPTDTVITLVAPVHLERLGSLEGVAREKAKLGHCVPEDGAIAFPAGCLDYGDFQNFRGTSLVAAERGEASAQAAGWAHGRRAEVFEFCTSQKPEATTLEIESPGGDREQFRLPKVSDGMAQNTALAILMARRHGCTPAGIAERLRTWKAPHLRGEIVRFPRFSVYADCYNANPAALRDSAAMFDAIADSSQPRLYLLGCMGELGEQAREMHREAGRSLPVRPGDKVCLLGAEADAFRAGILERDAAPQGENVRVCDSLEEMAGELKRFSGYVFLKGSRIYEMERLLSWAAEESNGGEGVAC